eukprot:589702-Rhodomonas_salina.2
MICGTEIQYAVLRYDVRYRDMMRGPGRAYGGRLDLVVSGVADDDVMLFQPARAIRWLSTAHHIPVPHSISQYRALLLRCHTRTATACTEHRTLVCDIPIQHDATIRDAGTAHLNTIHYASPAHRTTHAVPAHCTLQARPVPLCQNHATHSARGKLPALRHRWLNW